MPTIAKLSQKLDLSADEAVEILRKLHYKIAGVDAEIDDDQVDTLIEIDEDRTAFERKLAAIEKEEANRAKKAKAAAKKSAAEAKKKTTEKAVEIAEVAEIETVQEAVPEIVPEPVVIAPAPEVIVHEVPETIVEAAAPEHVSETVAEHAVVEAPVVEVEAPTPIETHEVPVVEAAPKPKPRAEIMKDEPVVAGEPHAFDDSLGLEEGEFADEAGAHGLSAEGGLAEAGAEDGPHEPEGALAAAERQHEEIERRKAARKKEGHREEKKDDRVAPPVPDPDVVARVIAMDQKRKAQRAAQLAGPPQRSSAPSPAPGGGSAPSGPKYKTQTTISFTAGDERGERSGPRGEKRGAGKTAKQKQKKAERLRLLEDNIRREAAAAVKEYQSGASVGGAKKRRRKRRDEDGSSEHESQSAGTIQVEENITVERLAAMMDISVSEIILELMESNILATKNQTLDLDLVRQIADSHGFDVEISIPEEEQIFTEEPDNPEDMERRNPVVTVMGHVDHGKTTLLDKVRTANVAAGEAGGITQHIAAYHVELPTGGVTFLDTPGHEAFTQMRARGAHVTDVVVLVVAANDGVKPQTIEAIDHAKAAEVPIVVAINKCDLGNAQPDRVRQELTQYGLLDEQWGGKTVMKDISAKMGVGVDDLMELLVIQAEMLDLKANPKKRAKGAIIESEITIGLGPVAWVLVQNGTLRVGDAFLAGTTYGRVRSMTNSKGEEIQEAGPSMPVVVTGFNSPPDAGDVFIVTQEERLARSIAEKRAAAQRLKKGPAVKHMTLEDFHARVAGSAQKTLQVILKADVQGSVDVLLTSLGKLGNEEVKVTVVHSGVGAVSESDVLLASASDAVIIGFHVTGNAKVKKLAEQEGVDIRTYRIIYEMLEEVRSALEGLLTPDKKEVVTGHVEVRRIFHSSALGNIAGCYVQDGDVTRGASARLIRDGVIIYQGRVDSLRREKDDARSVSTGFECGLKLEKYDDIQVGDIVEVFKIEQVAKVLA